MTSTSDGRRPVAEARGAEARARPPDSRGRLFALIEAQFEAAAGDPAIAEHGCLDLGLSLGIPPDDQDQEIFLGLSRLLSRRTGEVAAPVFLLLARILPSAPDPSPILEGMLRSRDVSLARRALGLVKERIEAGAVNLDPRLLACLAERAAEEASPFTDCSAQDEIAGLFAPREASPDAAILPYLDAMDPRIRDLAARLLDRRGEPAPTDAARRVLGPERFESLRPFLEHTRAGYRDLLVLRDAPGIAGDLERARAVCSADRLAEVVGRLGWAAVAVGFEVRALVPIRLGGAFPYLVPEAMTGIFERVPAVEFGEKTLLVVAQGRDPEARTDSTPDTDRVDRFRKYNLAHARLLADLMLLDPLTQPRLERILAGMDRVVDDFIVLFGESQTEAAALPGTYRALRDRIANGINSESGEGPLPGEIERLVLPFEEPRTLREVGTLHGLKRFLHREGLRLGIRLGDSSRKASRTVALAVVSPAGVETVARALSYTDFEAPEEGTSGTLTYPVSLVVEGLARHLLHRHRELPRVRVFCYGNEVHYFLSYGLHPAFVRIDFSPPARGGMIALEYFGVSKNDLSGHPNVALDAVRSFLEGLDFEVEIEATRVRARYDKERARHLGDLCDRAEFLFRLAPHLMDLDWVVGSLDLAAAARARVVDGWLGFFRDWGVLPTAQFLTSDRRGILRGFERTPTGEREIAWSGDGPYADRFAPAPRAEILAKSLAPAFRRESDGDVPAFVAPSSRPMGQLRLEEEFLRPWSLLARAGGDLPAGGPPGPPPGSAPCHPVAMFAEALDGGGETLRTLASLAPLVSRLERELGWTGMGSVNGYAVERGRLPLLGEWLRVLVLRDAHGVARLARFLCEDSIPGTEATGAEAIRVRTLLRQNGYLDPEPGDVASASEDEAEQLRSTFRSRNPSFRSRHLPGELVVNGFAAAPGRVAGLVALGTEGRRAETIEGAVLVAPAVRPADNALIYRSAGVVFTGGGVLSHAGLLACQFHKPALLIPGEWHRDSAGAVALTLQVLEFDEKARARGGYDLLLRRNLSRQGISLHEGDLVLLDGDHGILRVLGQNPVVLGLHRELRELCGAWREISKTRESGTLLALRGRRLRARHQLAKILGRIQEPGAIRYAVQELATADWPADSEADRELLLVGWLGGEQAGRAGRALEQAGEELRGRFLGFLAAAGRILPLSDRPHEILWLRLEAFRAEASLRTASRLLRRCGLPAPADDPSDRARFDRAVVDRFQDLRDTAMRAIRELEDTEDPHLRHRLARLEEMDRLLPGDESTRSEIEATHHRLDRGDAARVDTLRARRIYWPGDGGLELVSGMGRKAATLGELARLGEGSRIPAWFAVGDRAFREALLARPSHRMHPSETGPGLDASLGDAIAAILGRQDLAAAESSRRIRALWENLVLSPDLVEELRRALARLFAPPVSATTSQAAVFVAVRSSTQEEDTERAARAGEFETYLFVPPDARALDALKRAWAGFWSERAIHNRRVLGLTGERVGGGVLVQRMILPRASGVVQTVNVGSHDPGEMLVTVGLGVGEGVVSGTVGADLITVAKDSLGNGRSPRFRYVPGDKRTQMVFDRARGTGTVLVPSSYHQRFRPALEYMELRELIETAARLESAYGVPLDIEFAVEEGRLWILQARPVAQAQAVLQETRERFPLSPLPHPGGKEQDP